jgi:DNA-binding Lrp family transcriptional regulator
MDHGGYDRGMSGLEECEYMLKYLKVLDPTNARIIEGLGKYDPRNLLSLAQKTDLPPTTVAFRVKKLMAESFLTVRAKLNSPRLGLTKAVVVANTNRGFADTLSKTIENIGYWTYLAPCYGKFNGFYSIFSFPYKHVTELREYFEGAKQLGALSDYTLFLTSNVFDVAPSFTGFDFEHKTWNFSWEKWTADVLSGSQQVPAYLADPQSYEIQADMRDVLILKELEKDGLKDFTELAKIVDITPQGVRHRFHEHVLKRELLSGYEVAVFPYPLQVSDLCAFVVDFPNQSALGRFANSLRGKSFVISHAKVIGSNSLLIHFYVPKTEFTNLLSSLNRLTVKGIVQSFFYVFIDLSSFKRQTISYELFKNGAWEYSLEEKIKKLNKIVPMELVQSSR